MGRLKGRAVPEFECVFGAAGRDLGLPEVQRRVGRRRGCLSANLDPVYSARSDDDQASLPLLVSNQRAAVYLF